MSKFIQIRPDRLTYLTKKMGYNMLLPANSLNQRTSAHYIECNYIYGAEMVKRVLFLNLVFKDA